MAKFSINRFPAGFFDLSQDIAHRLPVDLIDAWTRSDQSQEAALRLLSPHLEFGTVVSTDSVGLTTLTKLRGVVEILALVNGPKEIVHACGKAVGGEPIGVWAADNTQMFYPFTAQGSARNPGLLLSMLLETMERVREQCELRIGACIHTGSFFRLGGGLYGREADRVEHFAEEHSGEGQVLMTDEFVSLLGSRHPFTVADCTDLRKKQVHVWNVTDGPRLKQLEATDLRYPYPYTDDFYDSLRGLAIPVQREAVKAIHTRYAVVRTVVVVEREKEEMDVPEVAVLNDLSLSAAMTRIASGILRQTGGTEIKTAANLGIYTFESAAPALEFSRRLRTTFREQGVAIRIGIAAGEVFVFDLGRGMVDIAGMPVNVASKISQDHGQFGRIYLSQESAAGVDCSRLEPYAVKIANVPLTGCVD